MYQNIEYSGLLMREKVNSKNEKQKNSLWVKMCVWEPIIHLIVSLSSVAWMNWKTKRERESFINHKENKRDACICLNCINFCQINYFSNMSKNPTKGTEPVASKKEETKPVAEPAKGAKAPADAGKTPPADQNKLGKPETTKAGDV